MDINLISLFINGFERYKKQIAKVQRWQERDNSELGDINDYFQWEKLFIEKQHVPTPSELTTMIRSGCHYYDYDPVYSLAERYRLPYVTIQKWIENKDIEVSIFAVSGSEINCKTGNIHYKLSLFIKKEYIDYIENIETDNNNLKKLKELAENKRESRQRMIEQVEQEFTRSLLRGGVKEYGSINNFFNTVINSFKQNEHKSDDDILKYNSENLLSKIGELEKKLSDATTQPHNDKGLSGLVCKLRREGKSDEEIAAYLYDGGTWCTQAQIGALLHADDSRVASASMQQRARRLLGKA